jgi:hypothetical protein
MSASTNRKTFEKWKRTYVCSRPVKRPTGHFNYEVVFAKLLLDIHKHTFCNHFFLVPVVFDSILNRIDYNIIRTFFMSPLCFESSESSYCCLKTQSFIVFNLSRTINVSQHFFSSYIFTFGSYIHTWWNDFEAFIFALIFFSATRGRCYDHHFLQFLRKYL